MKLTFFTEVLFFAAFVAATSDAWIPPVVTSTTPGSCHQNSAAMMGSHRTTPSSCTALNAAGGVEVIGKGRIGSLFESGDATFIGRNDPIDPDAAGRPILVATRNDALDGIVEKCPENRRKDLVFMQNGYLDNFLKSKGLLDNTQVLLFLSVPSLGAPPADGITTVNPEGYVTFLRTNILTFAFEYNCCPFFACAPMLYSNDNDVLLLKLFCVCVCFSFVSDPFFPLPTTLTD